MMEHGRRAETIRRAGEMSGFDSRTWERENCVALVLGFIPF